MTLEMLQYQWVSERKSAGVFSTTTGVLGHFKEHIACRTGELAARVSGEAIFIEQFQAIGGLLSVGRISTIVSL